MHSTFEKENAAVCLHIQLCMHMCVLCTRDEKEVTQPRHFLIYCSLLTICLFLRLVLKLRNLHSEFQLGAICVVLGFFCCNSCFHPFGFIKELLMVVLPVNCIAASLGHVLQLISPFQV